MDRHGPDAPSLVDALRELVAAGDLEGLARDLDANWIRLVTDEPVALHGLLTELPPDFVASHPRVAIARDMLFRFHDQSKVTATLSLAARYTELAETGAGLEDLLALGLGQMLALRSIREYEASRDIAVRDRNLTEKHAHAWLDIAPDLRCMVQLHWGLSRMAALDVSGAIEDFHQSYWAGRRSSSAYLARNAATNAALLFALTGSLADAEDFLGKARELDPAPEYLRQLVEDWGALVEAAVALARIDLDSAREALDRFVPAAESQWSWSIEHYVRARLGLLSGESHGALHVLDRAHHPRGGQAPADSFDEALLVAAKVDLALATGAGVRAELTLERAGESPEIAVPRARHALLRGDDSGALTQAVAGLTAKVQFGAVDLAVIAAVAALRLGRPRDAVGHARVALEVASTTGVLAPFALAPRADVVALLELVGADGAFVSAALEGVPEVFSRPITAVELSERERVVLRELTRTGSVQEIASSLFVSVNTVKSQVRSLYRKLGVNSREGALAEALRLGYHPGD